MGTTPANGELELVAVVLVSVGVAREASMNTLSSSSSPV